MELTLRYTEGPAVVTREYGLPDDEALRERLIGIIENDPELCRNEAEDAAALEAAEELWGEEEEPAAELPEEVEAEDWPEMKPFYMTEGPGSAGDGDRSGRKKADEEEETPAKGLCIIRCPGCGKLIYKHFREPETEFQCFCGYRIPVTNLTPANFRCTSCGRKWKYHTNEENNLVLSSCINCGAEMQSWWNEKKGRFQPAY